MGDRLIERLASLLSDVCGAPAAALGPESAPGATPGWDSVANISFIAAVEDEFGVTIATTEALAIKSLGDMAKLLAARGKTA
ncbi:MAG TPA: acyl carrier protein [Kofleriaceae bacterium]|nr:acyl carrier protein [Kofleriaceae bacterium]